MLHSYAKAAAQNGRLVLPKENLRTAKGIIWRLYSIRGYTGIAYGFVGITQGLSRKYIRAKSGLNRFS